MRRVETVCRRQGHLLAGWNLMVSSGRRRCRECHNAYARAYRAETPKLVVRCAACGGVFEDVLGDLNPCPHCGKIARGTAA